MRAHPGGPLCAPPANVLVPPAGRDRRQHRRSLPTRRSSDLLCGAQQDNSTVCIAARTDGIGIGEKDWYDVGGGESGWIAARQDDPHIVFAGSYGGLITRYDHRTGQERAINAWPDNPMGWGAANLKYRFQWTFPIVVAPVNPNDLLIAPQVLFRSSNEGQRRP